ncbi:hypothetical protein [Lacinutrix jangbogonensis]|uniref:hypothetical protein n=1 Tax=Lacinutrix jangbogonensis TaxID=1469557 RepID=UPI00053E58F6|nr:hypothetical protein [Lacinutrix jangbogonensis]
MNEQIDKNIERLTDKMMQEMPKASPSIDFTSIVMSQVEALESKAVIAYKPLISKSFWFVLCFLILAITLYLFFTINTEQTSLLASLDFNKLVNNRFTGAISKFEIPKTFMYAILFFGLLVCAQIPWLENYFNKRLTL